MTFNLVRCVVTSSPSADEMLTRLFASQCLARLAFVTQKIVSSISYPTLCDPAETETLIPFSPKKRWPLVDAGTRRSPLSTPSCASSTRVFPTATEFDSTTMNNPSSQLKLSLRQT